MTDKELYKLCCEFGAKTRMWSRKFAELLPEVEKRKLWKKHKMYSIYEFAKKLAGLNESTVDEILRTYKKVEDKPKLKAQIVKHGWGKVRAAVRIDEKEETLVKIVETLPKKAIEELARERKNVTCKNSPGWEFQSVTFKLDKDTQFKLKKYQQRLEKERREPVPLGEVLKTLLNQLEEPKKKTRKSKGTTGRNVSAQKKRGTDNHGKCTFPGCNKPHTCYHHPDRYAATQNHNRIVALCHEHHQLAHAGLIENEHDPPEKWRLRETPQPNSIDLKYQEHMKRAQAP